MKGLALGLSLSVAFILGCAAAPLIVPRMSAQPQATGTTRWEYTCLRDYDSPEPEEWNAFGSQGWEALGNRDSYGYACFKRPLH